MPSKEVKVLIQTYLNDDKALKLSVLDWKPENEELDLSFDDLFGVGRPDLTHQIQQIDPTNSKSTLDVISNLPAKQPIESLAAKILCKQLNFCKHHLNTDELQLAFLVADGLILLAAPIPFSVATASALIVKMRGKKICRCP